MSKVVATTVLPDSSASDLLTIGATSDSVAISGDSLNVDTLQDAGGNTIFVSDGSGTITSKNSGFPGALKLISTATPSGAANVSITSGLDSTYDVYCFKFINISPATDKQSFRIAFSTDSGSSYTAVCTTTFFEAGHDEADSWTALQYLTSEDVAQSYPVNLHREIGNGADECSSGELYLFAPSSTTYVKHFYSRGQVYSEDSPGVPYAYDDNSAGYVNTTSAVDAVQFTVASGNFDGIIKLYGISKS